MCDNSKTRRIRNLILHIFHSLYRLQVQYQLQENPSRVVPGPVENTRNDPKSLRRLERQSAEGLCQKQSRWAFDLGAEAYFANRKLRIKA